MFSYIFCTFAYKYLTTVCNNLNNLWHLFNTFYFNFWTNSYGGRIYQKCTFQTQQHEESTPIHVEKQQVMWTQYVYQQDTYRLHTYSTSLNNWLDLQIKRHKASEVTKNSAVDSFWIQLMDLAVTSPLKFPHSYHCAPIITKPETLPILLGWNFVWGTSWSKSKILKSADKR